MNLGKLVRTCALVMACLCLWAAVAAAQDASASLIVRSSEGAPEAAGEPSHSEARGESSHPAAVAGSSSASFVIPRRLVPATPGMQASYIIVERDVKEVLESSGLFQAFGELSWSNERAIRAHYSVAATFSDGEILLMILAQPIDPVTLEPYGPTRWEALYFITADHEVVKAGDVMVPEDYLDLVEPNWLVDWSATPVSDLPAGAIEPGYEWIAAADFSEADATVFGRFVGWEEREGHAGPVAYLTENIAISMSDPVVVAAGVDATDSADLILTGEYWLVPDGFPYGRRQNLSGDIRTSIATVDGGPDAGGNHFAAYQFFEQTIQSDGRPDLVWLGSDDDGILVPGRAVKGRLGPWSNTLSDGTYIDVYVYEGVAGETVTIVLESDDFDAFLMVFAEDDSLLAEDDDSAGGTNATLTLTLPYTGIYFVVANSFYWGDQGSYTVTLTRGNPTP